MMRTIKEVDDEIKLLRERKPLGTMCEVYSRIVGYYRNIVNWNPGKREEFAQRQVFRLRSKH